MAIYNTTVPTPNAKIYTSSGSTAVTAVYFCNTTASPVTLNVYVAPSGTSTPVSSTYQIAKSVSLAANATYQLSDLNGNGIKLVLDSGDFVAADCTAAIAVTVVYVAV